jgi:hypothetical protein
MARQGRARMPRLPGSAHDSFASLAIIGESVRRSTRSYINCCCRHLQNKRCPEMFRR